MKCIACHSTGLRPFLSLGDTPVANALRSEQDLSKPEPRFPLEVAFCPDCALVQTTCALDRESIFDASYPYFSSYSDQLLDHSRRHAEGLIAERRLGKDSLVVELASNDGYLLRNFVAAGVPVLGIEPAPTQAQVAESIGVPTILDFFGEELASKLLTEGRRADVIIANNVMAHVPDVNDFVGGIAVMLADDGVATIENPYVRDMIERCEFDQIYHEHRCYFSCTAVSNLMERHGLHLNHVEYFRELHGGTLRWHVSHSNSRSAAAQTYLDAERTAGLDTLDYYQGFAERVSQVKAELRDLLVELRGKGARIAGYGAAAKGSTLINYADLGVDVIDYVVDRNKYKQGLYMPGHQIPIRDPEVLQTDMPDYLLLLAWNFEEEIARQQESYLAAGGRFIVPVPSPRIREWHGVGAVART
ncbi:MAG TPA: class I SAM-dependent methyltransferase [Dehalococcoidia bacterium]|nr:class I SAM-dependent methyltransferase [Dehalococcoidia bacterium]